MEAENRGTVESRGTISRIKEQHEKHEKFVG
jgi:hypothetical protein